MCLHQVNNWLVALGPLGTSCSWCKEWGCGGGRHSRPPRWWRSELLGLAFLVLHGSLFTLSPRLTHSHNLLAPAWLSYLQLIPQTCALSLPGLCKYPLQDSSTWGPDRAPASWQPGTLVHILCISPDLLLSPGRLPENILQLDWGPPPDSLADLALCA